MRERPESFLEWLITLSIHIPFVILTFAALMAPIDALAKPALLLAVLFALATSAVNYAALRDTRPGGDDASLILVLLLFAPFELLLSLWALGAVLMERRRMQL